MKPNPDLTQTNVDELSVFSNPYDLRQNLHTFVEYVQGRDVKRLHRSNDLNRSDSKRLAKLMGLSDVIKEIEEEGSSEWIDYVDGLALAMDFVDYDTAGEYAGYSSHEPSYPENYIEFNLEEYTKFIDLPLLEQENKLFEESIENYMNRSNEFYSASVFGKLSGFSTWGSATGVMSGLNFGKARRFLFEVLQSCTPGIWYTTSSLIQYLKEHHPYFLIPKNPEYEREWEAKKGRYGNFHETTDKWGEQIQIAESDPDGFERVEGRYVERFLEGLPLILGYIGVAYSRTEYKGKLPEINQLQAFRVNDTFLRVMIREIIEPKVTVQPNFEVHVESELYPVRILAQLSKLADVITKDKTSILKLQKKKVLAQLSERDDLDVIKLLENMSAQKLPQNVKIELEEWIGASEAFTLYEGAALFEGDKDLPDLKRFTIECISPTMRIVHSPDKLFTHLEKKELIPLCIKHRQSALSPLPEDACTAFPKLDSSLLKANENAKAKAKKSVTIKREVMITLHFPAKELMEEFRNQLIAARCPVAADWSKLTLSFANNYESEIKKISTSLKQDYTIKIEDLT